MTSALLLHDGTSTDLLVAGCKHLPLVQAGLSYLPAQQDCFILSLICFWTRTQVSATSRTDYAEQAAALGVSFFTDANDFCEEHPDVVILASSILSLDAVLSSLPVQRLRRSTLFVDVLSVKEFPKQLMLSSLPPEVQPAPLGSHTVLWDACIVPAYAEVLR